MHWSVNLLIVLAVFVVPIVLGSYLSRLWRMSEYSGKIALVLFTTLAGLAISFCGWPPRLGIDLRGGVILIYDIPESGMEKVGVTAKTGATAQPQPSANGKQSVDMDKLIAAVSRRINPGGVREITIRPYGARQIEVIIPEADEAETKRIKEMISKIGTLEFRILATTIRETYRSYIDRAKKLPDNQFELKDAEGAVLAKWVPVAKGSEHEFLSPRGDIAKRTVKRRNQDAVDVLVIQDPYNITGGYLKSARAGESMGQPCVLFGFNNEGAGYFGRLTGSHLPDTVQNQEYRLGIILDGYLQSAPGIKSTITDSGQITGIPSQKEVETVVNVLNAGSLPTALSTEPISEAFIGPTLGADTIRMGRDSMVLSMVLVCAFMLFYYRFAGIIACFALAANMILLLACMIAIHAAFSLPGLAGFALTIGMAVDSNVLIYERIREELDRGAALRMAIRNGFDRAFSAIFDSHLTTLISAAVLYAIGQEQIKGFAITLFLGVAINLYTAVFCVHVVFDVAERQKWISRLKMMRMFTKANVDFWGLRYTCYTLSIVVTVIGLVAVFARGPNLLNIDFTGGVSIQVVFDKPQDIEKVRKTLESAGLKDRDPVVSDVNVQDEEKGRRFMVNVSSPPGVEAAAYLKTIQDKIRDTFPGQLTTNTVTVNDVTPVGAAEKPAAKPAVEPGKATPAPKAQSRNDLPSDAMLASTDSKDVLLALAEPAKGSASPAVPTPPASKAAEPRAPPPAEKTADKAPAKAPPALPAKTPAPVSDAKAVAPTVPPGGQSQRGVAGGDNGSLRGRHASHASLCPEDPPRRRGADDPQRTGIARRPAQ